MRDAHNRTVDYLRLSVTDQCNLRCSYCIPNEGVSCPKRADYLSVQEIIKLTTAFAHIGIKKVKLTGGEPLVRKDLAKIVRGIRQISGIEQITLTTNGILLEEQLDELLEAGITHINISLDTLDREVFKQITCVDGLERVLRGIRKAAESTLQSVKINALIAKGMNEDAIVPLAALARQYNIHVRFIELMPIGCGKQYTKMAKDEVGAVLTQAYGTLQPYTHRIGNGPATYWSIEGFKGKIGFISAMSQCFCERCNRVRLSATGFLKLCLHSKEGMDIRNLLYETADDKVLEAIIEALIYNKPAEHHLQDGQSGEDQMMVQIGG